MPSLKEAHRSSSLAYTDPIETGDIKDGWCLICDQPIETIRDLVPGTNQHKRLNTVEEAGNASQA
jgi:hypothetical protein